MVHPDAPASQTTDGNFTPAPAAHPARSVPAVIALVCVIAAGLLAPIWSVRYPPIVDYPNHLASAFVLAHLRDAAFHFGQYYGAKWNTYPYLAMDATLLSLQRFLPVELAGRLLLSLCVLSVPAAIWFFIRRANPGEENLVFWSLLVSNNLYFLLYGFLNLQLSMAICFFLLGLWLRYLERPRLGTWCLLLLVTTALYFSHVMGFAIAAVIMTVYVWSARRPIKDAVWAWALYIPGALFYLHAVVGHGSRGALQFRDIPEKAGGLVVLVVGSSTLVDVVTLAVMLGVLAWAQIDNPEFQWNRPWRRATWILFLFYWLLPAAQGPATNIDKRLLPFVFLLSLAGARVGRRGRKLAIVALGLFFLRAGTLERQFVAVSPHLQQLERSFTSVSHSARVLPLVDWANGAPLPERHFWAYGVIERGWVSPCLFHDPGVHSLVLKAPTYDPCGIALTPASKLDWGRVQNDFDYVWAYHVPQFSAPLSSVGSLVLRDGDLEVFRLHGATSAGDRVAP